MRTILIGGAAIIAILLVIFFIKKAKDKKKEAEAEAQAMAEMQEEEKANFTGLMNKDFIGKRANPRFPLKLGSESPEVEQLQRYLDKVMREKMGDSLLHKVNIGYFDPATLEATQKVFGVDKISEEMYRKFTDAKGRRIAQFQTVKY